MRIAELRVLQGYRLEVKTTQGVLGVFDVSPYLEYQAFAPLKDEEEFRKVSNGGYFVEWDCGADLSADTIEAKMKTMSSSGQPSHA